ncbi:MAG: hypothetical protein WKF59_25465 [Chitinophagaceae bacterium]
MPDLSGSPAMNFIKGSIQNENGFIFKSDEGKCHIPLGNNLSEVLKDHINKPIEIGIRPEHIVVEENNPDSYRDEKADCLLEVTAYENMGNEQLVYFKLQEKPLIIRREPKEDVEFEQVKSLSFSKDRIIFIEPQSGEVLKN